jgi:hypothetical protein
VERPPLYLNIKTGDELFKKIITPAFTQELVVSPEHMFEVEPFTN